MQDYWNNPPEEPEPPEWFEMLDDMLSNIPMPDSIASAMRKAMDDWIDECNQEQADPSWANSPIHKEIQEFESMTRPQDGRICQCEDAPCCGCYSIG